MTQQDISGLNNNYHCSNSIVKAMLKLNIHDFGLYFGYSDECVFKEVFFFL